MSFKGKFHFELLKRISASACFLHFSPLPPEPEKERERERETVREADFERIDTTRCVATWTIVVAVILACIYGCIFQVSIRRVSGNLRTYQERKKFSLEARVEMEEVLVKVRVCRSTSLPVGKRNILTKRLIYASVGIQSFLTY